MRKETEFLPAQVDPALGNGGEPAERLSQRAYQAIRVALQSGELRPGQRLILRPLASKLGLSATPVREALLRLVSEQALGLDERNSVLVPLLDGEDLEELEELRTDIEGRAAALTAKRASAIQLGELATIHADMAAAETAGDTVAMLEADSRFHHMILELSGRPTMLRVVESIQARLGPVISMTRETKIDATGEHAHLRILAAMQNGDAEAARAAMIEDIGQSFRVLRRALANHAPELALA